MHQLQYCYTVNTACSPAQLQILSLASELLTFATVRWCRCVRHDRHWFICQSFMRIFLIVRVAQKWFEFYLYHNYVLGLNWSRSGQPNLIEDHYCREKIQTFWTSPIFFPIYKSYKFYLHKAPYFRVFCV